MTAVTLEHVSKQFNSLTVVDDVSLSINESELMVLVGPSGCGKSTTLRMIAGLEETSSGTIQIGGRDVTNLEPRDRNVAMVFQNYALYPHKSVYDNLAFGLKMRRVDKAEIDKSVRRAAAVLGIEPLLMRRPSQLSGGQMQRVALGRALVREPDTFLLDEPLSNLDAKMRVQMREEIARLHTQTRVSMIYVTHDQVEAMTLGDRICVMRAGQVQQVGAPLKVYNEPANTFVAGFIGSPEMNLLNGEIVSGPSFQAGELSVALSSERFILPTVGTPVTLGIRPEHVHVLPHTRGLAARVSMIERFGAQMSIVAQTGIGRVTAMTIGDEQLQAGAEIGFDFDANRLHLFSAVEGKSLRR